ncbi:MAG: universal stress protein [Gemmatirosa sp.]|nr:universal stress protein [Gemmatirosa sp.]
MRSIDAPNGVVTGGRIGAYHPSTDGPRPHLHGPVLLAADGSELAGNAARVALAVAGHAGATLQVVSVVDTRGVPIPPPLDLAIGLADDIVGPAVHEAQASDVRTALAAALDTTVDWPVHVAIGTPAQEIAQRAADGLVGLVVVGLRRHGALGRALQDETALRVMRRATCPVLAVTPALASLPRHVVVGLDFDRASEQAARLALELLAPDGTLTLAHAPSGLWHEAETAEHRIHALGVEAAFDALLHDLAPPPGVVVERVVLEEPARRARPADRLLAFAERTHADLLALGSRRHGRLERWLLGSVVTDVVRDGSVSVLVVPPDA